MDSLWLEIVGILLLIGLVGVLSAGEVAVVSTRKSRMKELVDEGNTRASHVLAFKSNPEQFLATVHIGTVLSLILASGIGGILAFQDLAPALDALDTRIIEWSNWLAGGLVVMVISAVVVVFGELVPKSLALRHAERIALQLAPFLRFLATMLRVPAIALTFAGNLVLAPFKDRASFTESKISEEEFKLMLEEGTKSGVIDKTEHELIESIFEFTDTTVKEVMIPRPDVVALNVSAPRETIVRIVLDEGYSRLPVYRDTVDNILGVVYTKDLLGLIEYRDLIILQDVIRPAYFIPETKKISQLMRELQQRRLHMAIVIDEFGGTEGIVTMEDILEEIVGEIHDEYDEELKDVESSADGSFLVNARVSIRYFNDRFDVTVPETDEYETLSGFLYKLTGRIPDLNEEIQHDRLSFTIMKKSQRRIRLVKVRKLPPAVVDDRAAASAEGAT